VSIPQPRARRAAPVPDLSRASGRGGCPDIRRSIAFGITGCALDPNQAKVVEAQLCLAEDEAADVPYYAVYDFTEDITADNSKIRAMLRRRLTDPDEQIPEKATEALRMRGDLEVEGSHGKDQA